MLNELIKIIENEYDAFKTLSFFKNDDIISEIENLCIEEEKLIDKLPKNISFLENLSLMVHNYYNCDFSDKRYFVLLRFDNILESLKADIENLSLDDFMFDEFYDGYSSYNFVREKFFRNFILNNNEYAYLAAFSIKDISDSLIINNFDFNCLGISNNCIRDESSDNLEFIQFYDECLCSEARSKIMEILGCFDFSVSSFLYGYHMSLLNNLLINLNEDDFCILYNEFINDSFCFSKKIYDDILNVFEKIKKTKNNYDLNPVIHNVNINLFDSLVNLIKFEEVLFLKYESNDFFSEDNLKSFSKLLSYESELVSSIMIDEYDADILKDVIGKDIVFFLNNGSKDICNLISNRILNLLPIFCENNSSFIKKNYDFIIKNHIINSLNQFKYVICGLNNNSEISNYVNVYKRIIFQYPDLLNDVFIMGYDFDILFSLDDDLVSNIIGLNNSLTYVYDKDEILYLLGQSLIEEISDVYLDVKCNNDLNGYLQFKFCEFNDIINNVNVEHLYSLLGMVEDIKDFELKKSFLKKINYNHKYRI